MSHSSGLPSRTLLLQENARLRARIAELEAAPSTDASEAEMLFESVPCAITHSTPEGTLVGVNAACARLFGYASPDEFLTASQAGVQHHADPAQQAQWLTVVRSQAQPVRAEMRYHRRDGGEFTGRVTMFVGRDRQRIQFVESIIEEVIESQTASEHFGRATLDALNAHIAVLDETGIILTVNQAWRSFALDNPPVTTNVNVGANYLTICDAVTPGGEDARTATAMAAGLRAVLRGTQNSFALEYQCNSPTEQRWFYVRVARFLSAGRPQVVVAHEDITALKLAEARLRRFWDLPLLGMAITSPDRRFLEVNQKLADILGYTPGELAGLSWVAVSHLDDVAENTELLERTLAGESDEYHMEKRFIHKTGALVYTRLAAHCIRRADGGVDHLALVVEDISARRRAEAALRETESVYRQLVEHAPVGMLFYELRPDQALVLIDANAAADRLLGIAHAPLIGQTIEAAFPLLAATEVPSRYREAAAHGLIWGTDQIDYQDEQIRGAFEVKAFQISPNRMVAMFANITERLRTEAALRESEARNRAYLNAIPDLIFIVDAEGRYLDYHTPDPALLMAPPEQFLGRRIGDLLPAELVVPSLACIQQALATGQTQELEYSLQLPDGQHWHEFRLAAIDDQRVMAIVRDVTERQRLQIELRTGRDFALSVMNTIGQGLTVTDAEAHYEYINPAYVQLTGYSSESLLGRSPTEVIVEANPREPTQMSAGRLAGETLTYEARLRRVDGSLVEVLVTDTPRWQSGQVRGTITVITDLTERKQAERAMEAERVRLRALIAASHDGILLIGTDEQIYVVNEPAHRYLNLSGRREDWESRDLSQMLESLATQPAAKAVFAEMRRAQTGDPQPHDGEWMLGARALYWISQPVRSVDRWLGWLLVLRDVTAERQLKQLREDLTRAMVHDLRNPLASLYGTLQLFRRGGVSCLSLQQRELLQTMDSLTTGMQELVTAILDVSRLEGGQMPLEREPVSLEELVTAVIRQQAPLAADRQLTLLTDFAPHLPIIYADVGLLRRVLQNLIGNALKFTPAGGQILVTVTLSTGEHEIQVEVRDTGLGLAPEIQGRLFQKFVSGREPGHGSGLGLAFCRQVIEAQGGRIWAESAPEQGAVFTFTLPRGQPPADNR